LGYMYGLNRNPVARLTAAGHNAQAFACKLF